MKNKSPLEMAKERISLTTLKDVVDNAEAYSLEQYEDFIIYSPDGYICDGVYFDEYSVVEQGIENELYGIIGELTDDPTTFIQKRSRELFSEWEVINN